LVHLGGTAVDANIGEGYANVATGRLSGTGIRNAKPGAARRGAKLYKTADAGGC